MVLHPCEDIVVDIAEKMDIGLDSPIVLHIFQRWVLTKHATVPSAHLVIRPLLHVLYLLRLQEGYRLLVEILVDPRGYVPVLSRDELVSYLRLRSCPCPLLEILGERLVVEKGPWVVELVIPCSLQIMHTLEQIIDLLVPYQAQKCSVDACAVRVVRCVVVSVYSSQRFWRFARRYSNISASLIQSQDMFGIDIRSCCGSWSHWPSLDSGTLFGTCSSPADGAFNIWKNRKTKTHIVAPARMRMLFGSAMV